MDSSASSARENLYAPGGTDWKANLPCSSISANGRSIGVAASSALDQVQLHIAGLDPGRHDDVALDARHLA